VYELLEDGTDMLKHIVVVKDHTFRYVCNLCIELVLQMNGNVSSDSVKRWGVSWPGE